MGLLQDWAWLIHLVNAVLSLVFAYITLYPGDGESSADTVFFAGLMIVLLGGLTVSLNNAEILARSS